MKGRIQLAFAGAALALYAATGVAAFAQPAPAGPGAGPPMHGDRMMRPEKTPAERAAHLRDALQLKPAQEPALQAFVSALETARQDAEGAMQADMGGAKPQTTPERLDRMQQMMTRHQAALSAVIEATRRFYAQLDPAQKRAFDALAPMMLHHHHMMGGHGMMHGRDGGPPPPPPEA